MSEIVQNVDKHLLNLMMCMVYLSSFIHANIHFGPDAGTIFPIQKYRHIVLYAKKLSHIYEMYRVLHILFQFSYILILCSASATSPSPIPIHL